MTAAPIPTALTDAILFTGDVFVEKQALLMAEGQIVDLVANDKVSPHFQQVSCGGHILAPAFIDCQVNGGGNVLLNATPTCAGVLAIAAAHRKAGTTRLLPTCITDSPETMTAAITATRQARAQDSSILGIHLEGPHISVAKKGTHNAAFVRPMNDQDLKIYHAQEGEIMMITLAPEQVTPDQITQLIAQGVIISLGHSAASADQTRAALEAGAKGFTHLFNGMTAMGGRDPSLAAIALDHAPSYAGLIGDAIHVAPEMMRLAARAKDNLFLVSDAMPPAGAEKPESFALCGANAASNGQACYNEEGGLCGAALTLGECVPRCIRAVRLDPERVLRMASTLPAAFLGRGHTLGKLLPSYTADIVMLDHSFKTQKVWQDGTESFHHDHAL